MKQLFIILGITITLVICAAGTLIAVTPPRLTDMLTEDTTEVVCQFVFIEFASASLCDWMRRIILYGIVMGALAIGALVAAWLFRNEIITFLKQTFTKIT